MAFEPLSHFINKALAYDPNSSTILKSLDQKKVQFFIAGFNFYIFFDNTGLQFRQSSSLSAPEADLKISGPLVSFIVLFATKDTTLAAKLGLTLEGDMEIAVSIQDLFLNIDIDWEEPLSLITNDSMAHFIGGLFRTFKKRQKEFVSNFTVNVKEYLQEEINLLPSAKAFESAVLELENLMESCDRLNARLQLLEHRLDEVLELESIEYVHTSIDQTTEEKSI